MSNDRYRQGPEIAYDPTKVISAEDTRNWLSNGPTNDLINKSRESGEYMNSKGLTTSQFRSIFTRLKKIETFGLDQTSYPELIMLKPLVAYAAKRAGKPGFRELKEKIIDPGIEMIIKEADPDKRNSYFKNFIMLFEAVLAYFIAAGGR